METSMEDSARRSIRTLLDEHRSISAVLLGLKELARMAQDATARPDFRAMRAMIRYIDEYPERLHHPKEDQYLFARLAQRWPEARPLIADLKAEHVAGAQRVRDLERAMLFLEEGWPAGARELLEAVDAYAAFHWEHMRKEERDLIPLAERHLKDEDWRAIDDAFSVNTNPIADLRERDFAELFTRIVNLAPAPVGLGEPWKRPS
jgi:branched-chain amino acid transport system ATP-binding protein